MIYRMGAALMSLLGLFVSAYLYLYKIGRIGTLACGSGGCETVQTSPWSRFLGVDVALIGLIGYAAAPGRGAARAAGRPGGAPPARAPADRAGGGRRAVHRLSHLPRALRHPRHLPLVRRVGGHHRDHLFSALLALRRLRRPDSRSVHRNRQGPAQGARAPGAVPSRRSGVVYGDIGTSPLYALKECFAGHHSIPPTRENVLGVLSLVVLVAQLRGLVQVRAFVLRADNRGEGGILALLALVRPSGTRARRAGGAGRRSGCSARRCSTATGHHARPSRCWAPSKGSASRRPRSTASSWPIAVVILSALFFFQRQGTAGRRPRCSGRSWPSGSSASRLLGIRGILRHPSVLRRDQPGARHRPLPARRAAGLPGARCRSSW